MKNIFFLFVLLFTSLSVFSQAPCPIIKFCYDVAGNRTQRTLEVVVCGPQNPSGRDANHEADTATTPKMNVIVYPNPTQDKINIVLTKDSSETESSLLLMDLSGKTVYTGVSSALQMQIDVSELAAGTYRSEERRVG